MREEKNGSNAGLECWAENGYIYGGLWEGPIPRVRHTHTRTIDAITLQQRHDCHFLFPAMSADWTVPSRQLVKFAMYSTCMSDDKCFAVSARQIPSCMQSVS